MLRSETNMIRTKKFTGGRQQIRIQKAPIHETRHTTKSDKSNFHCYKYF